MWRRKIRKPNVAFLSPQSSLRARGERAAGFGRAMARARASGADVESALATLRSARAALSAAGADRGAEEGDQQRLVAAALGARRSLGAA